MLCSWLKCGILSLFDDILDEWLNWPLLLLLRAKFKPERLWADKFDGCCCELSDCELLFVVTFVEVGGKKKDGLNRLNAAAAACWAL